MPEMPLRTVVVGGGITGLACAYRLQNRLTILGRPFEIFLIEASNRLGGLIRTTSRDGFLLEEGPDAFLSEKPRGIGLCTDLAVSQHLVSIRPDSRRSFIVKKNRLYPIPRGFHLIAPTDPLEMVTTPLLSVKGKIRLFRELFVPAAPPPDESVGAFVRRRFGPEVLERLAQPIVNGIYGADPEQLSLRATFPQYLELEAKGSLMKQALAGSKGVAAAQASGARYSMLMSFKNGMQTLVDELCARMPQVGAQLGVSVKRLQGLESGWRVTLSSGQDIDTDAVCLATPADVSAALLADVDPGLAKIIGEIPHADSLCVYYALKESDIGRTVDGAGILMPLAERKSFTACTFAHRKFAGRAPKGHALLRVFAGGKAAQALWGLSDADIDKRMFTDLKNLLQIKGSPLFSTVYRYPKGLPNYTVGHMDRTESVRQRLAALPGLAVTGNWRYGIGVPDCIDAGERGAEQLVTDLCRV